MPARRDYSLEAEALFRAFAARHGFTIEKVEQENIEVMMTVPAQPRLSFEITLGLQNADEINIGVGEFWSYFFPFEKVAAQVDSYLDGLVTGRCRIAHDRFGVLTLKHRMEERLDDGSWRTVYTAHGWLLPFVKGRTEYLSNTG